MATDQRDTAQAILTIAQRQARRDHEQIRETLLRMRHDWSQVSPELEAAADLMIDAFDGFGLKVQGVAL